MKTLGELGLPIQFYSKIFTSEDFSATGIDDISFLISTIKGKEPEPLNTVASGGELSRLLLAFYSFLSHHTHPICFFFDEIDTGVGGLTANAMASTLSSIANIINYLHYTFSSNCR